MLTSLLTLYIISALQSDLNSIAILPNQENFIKTASSGFSSLMEKGSAGPIKKPEMIKPVIEAEASLAMDMGSGEILFENNVHERLQIASITKLMTILIILEENQLDEIVTINSDANGTEGSTMYLRTGEQITIENLLYGTLINSANDAAVALAEYNAETTEAFVEKMNKRASELGLINTHFSNPIGLDSSRNYSSAYDIAVLARYLYHNKFVKKTAEIKELEVTSIDGKFTHKLKSTNELLSSYLHIKGLKTGKTPLAGLCLVTIAENDTGNEIITVVLNSPARFPETKILIDWVFRAYKWK